MANYSLVIGSKYSPFTFDELLKPALLATQAHRELEDQYSELGIKANSWEDLINEQVDAELHGKVSQYSKDLKSQADLLASQGLTPTTRKELLAMKNRYSKDITPIEKAYNKREELAKEQREALLKDPSLIFDTDYSTASLKSIMNNPSASFNPISGKEITKRAATMAKEAADIIMSDPEYSSVFGGQYVQQKINQGYTIEQVIAAAQRDPNAPKALLGIVDSIKDEVGYDNWNDENKAKIDSYINEGLNSAVGTPKIDVMANKGYVNPLDREREKLQEELIRAQIEEAKGTELPGGGKVIKLGGGKFAEYDSSGNLVRTNAITTTQEEKDQHKAKEELDKMLSSVVKVSDMKGTGFTPVGAVVKSNGIWVGGREGEDIPGSWRGVARTNLKEESAGWNRFYDPMSWFTGSGDFSYTPYDSNAEATVVTNPETIPGFLEYLNGAEDISNTAFGKILERARIAGISDEEFASDNTQIVKVKAKGKRVSSDEPYDYLIYRKS